MTTMVTVYTHTNSGQTRLADIMESSHPDFDIVSSTIVQLTLPCTTSWSCMWSRL